jgi:hypothetical protein
MAGLGLTFALVFVSGQLAAAQAATFTCDRLEAPGLRLQRSAALIGRKPNPGAAKVCDHCVQAAWSLEAEWNAEDSTSFESIANRMCSAELGWKEYQPGICTAGGPPPICVQNHWYRSDPRDTRLAFYQWNQQVGAQREAEMMRVACNCYASELAQTTVTRPPPVGDQSGLATLSVPCPSGTCPVPGASCSGGYCRIQEAPATPLDAARRAAAGAAADAGADAFKDAVIDAFSASVAALRKTVSYQILIGVFQTQSLGLYRDAYGRGLGNLSLHLSRFRQLYAEYLRARAGTPLARSPGQVAAELDALKTDLRSDLGTLAEAYIGVVRERELSRYACYNVLEQQHSRIAEYVTSVIAIPTPSGLGGH